MPNSLAWLLDMLPLENTNKDSSFIFLLGTYVMKSKFKLENILLWNATCMTLSHDCVTLSSIALSIFLQIILEPLVLIMDKVPLQYSSIEQKHSPCQLYFPIFLIFSLSILFSYLSRYHILVMVYFYALCNKLLI